MGSTADINFSDVAFASFFGYDFGVNIGFRPPHVLQTVLYTKTYTITIDYLKIFMFKQYRISSLETLDFSFIFKIFSTHNINR
jgi:hypothetical protein